MTFRRRRRGFARRMRRKMTWLSGSNPGCNTRLSISDCSSENPNIDVFTVVENPFDPLAGVVSSVSEVTLLRLVGEQFVGFVVNPGAGNGGTFNIIFCEGFYIADTASGLTLAKDPSSAAEQSSSDWLWRRTTVFANNVLSGSANQCNDKSVLSSNNGPHIDVTSKRKLRKEESIFYAVVCLLDQQSPHVVVGGGIAGTDVSPYAYGSVRALIGLP